MLADTVAITTLSFCPLLGLGYILEVAWNCRIRMSLKFVIIQSTFPSILDYQLDVQIAPVMFQLPVELLQF